MSQAEVGIPFYPLCVSLIGDRRHHVIGRLSRSLQTTHNTTDLPKQALLHDFLPTMESGVYLDGPHHPVGELQSRHGCGRAEGGGAALEAAHYTAVLPVLLDGEPDQVPESLDWTEHRR